MLDVSPDRGTRNGRWCERKRAPKVDASGDSVDGIELFFFPGYGFTIACTGEKKGPSRWPSHRCRVFRALARYTSAPKVRPVATRRTLPEPQRSVGTREAAYAWGLACVLAGLVQHPATVDQGRWPHDLSLSDASQPEGGQKIENQKV